MLSLCCTRVIRDRLRLPPQLPAPVQPSTRLGNWYVHLARFGHQQIVLATSERSSLTVFLPALCSAIIRGGCRSGRSPEAWTRGFVAVHDWTMLRLIEILVQLAAVCLRWCGLAFRPSRAVQAENLFWVDS